MELEYLILSVEFITGKTLSRKYISCIFMKTRIANGRIFNFNCLCRIYNRKNPPRKYISCIFMKTRIANGRIFNFICRIYNSKPFQENTYFLYFYSSYENKDCKRMICYPEIRSTWKIIIKYHSKEWKGRGKKELSSDRTEDRIGRGERRGKGWIPPLVNGGIRRIQTYSSWIWRLAV